MSDEEQQECSEGSVGSRIGCILNYNGDTTDIIINYTLLGLNLIWCIIALCFHTTDIEKKNKLIRFAIGSLIFGTLCGASCKILHQTNLTFHGTLLVFAFQISVCLWVYCSGISIIWCAMGGWITSERKRLRVQDPTSTGGDLFRRFSVVAEMLVVMIDIVAIIYYAFVSPFVTTVAHVLSLILGAALSLISIKRYDEDHGQSVESPSTPATPFLMT